jgi:hypothetical protein
VHGQAWKRREHGSESRASMVRGARGMRGGDSCGHGGKCTYERAKTVQHRSVTRREGRRAGYTWSTLVRIEPETPHRCSFARARSLFAPPLHPARADLRSGPLHWMHTCSRRCHLIGAASCCCSPQALPSCCQGRVFRDPPIKGCVFGVRSTCMLPILRTKLLVLFSTTSAQQAPGAGGARTQLLAYPPAIPAPPKAPRRHAASP